MPTATNSSHKAGVKYSVCHIYWICVYRFFFIPTDRKCQIYKYNCVLILKVSLNKTTSALCLHLKYQDHNFFSHSKVSLQFSAPSEKPLVHFQAALKLKWFGHGTVKSPPVLNFAFQVFYFFILFFFLIRRWNQWWSQRHFMETGSLIYSKFDSFL